MFNWKLERFPQLMIGWWFRQRKNDVTWVLHRKNKIYYLCKSKERPERLIKFMCLVPDFYVFGWRGYTYCYWTSEPKISFFPCTDGIKLAKTLPPFKMEDYKKYLDEIRRKGH